MSQSDIHRIANVPEERIVVFGDDKIISTAPILRDKITKRSDGTISTSVIMVPTNEMSRWDIHRIANVPEEHLVGRKQHHPKKPSVPEERIVFFGDDKIISTAPILRDKITKRSDGTISTSVIMVPTNEMSRWDIHRIANVPEEHLVGRKQHHPKKPSVPEERIVVFGDDKIISTAPILRDKITKRSAGTMANSVVIVSTNEMSRRDMRTKSCSSGTFCW